MKKYRSEKSGQAILETYDRLLSGWQCGTKEKDVETEYGTTHVIECGADLQRAGAGEAFPPLRHRHDGRSGEECAQRKLQQGI